jgi:hypothetical protein
VAIKSDDAKKHPPQSTPTPRWGHQTVPAR